MQYASEGGEGPPFLLLPPLPPPFRSLQLLSTARCRFWSAGNLVEIQTQLNKWPCSAPPPRPLPIIHACTPPHSHRTLPTTPFPTADKDCSPDNANCCSKNKEVHTDEDGSGFLIDIETHALKSVWDYDDGHNWLVAPAHYRM